MQATVNRKARRLDVTCEQDGLLVIRADSTTAALLAGREQFGSVEETQVELAERICDAWYAAGCPKGGTR